MTGWYAGMEQPAMVSLVHDEHAGRAVTGHTPMSETTAWTGLQTTRLPYVTCNITLQMIY